VGELERRSWWYNGRPLVSRRLPTRAVTRRKLGHSSHDGFISGSIIHSRVALTHKIVASLLQRVNAVCHEWSGEEKVNRNVGGGIDHMTDGSAKAATWNSCSTQGCPADNQTPVRVIQS
jgi:hypothetical protein